MVTSNSSHIPFASSTRYVKTPPPIASTMCSTFTFFLSTFVPFQFVQPNQLSYSSQSISYIYCLYILLLFVYAAAYIYYCFFYMLPLLYILLLFLYITAYIYYCFFYMLLLIYITSFLILLNYY